MATFREPRRVARQSWEVGTHLGELDSDVDELHSLRDKDKIESAEAIASINKKIDKLYAAAIGAVIAGAGAAISLTANILMKTLS